MEFTVRKIIHERKVLDWTLSDLTFRLSGSDLTHELKLYSYEFGAGVQPVAEQALPVLEDVIIRNYFPEYQPLYYWSGVADLHSPSLIDFLRKAFASRHENINHPINKAILDSCLKKIHYGLLPSDFDLELTLRTPIKIWASFVRGRVPLLQEKKDKIIEMNFPNAPSA